MFKGRVKGLERQGVVWSVPVGYTAVALLLAAIEYYLITRQFPFPGFVPKAFWIIALAGTVWFWLLLVWLFWQTLQWLRRGFTSGMSNVAAHTGLTACAFALGFLYLASWLLYGYVGAFPSPDHLSLLDDDSGFGFIISTVKQSFPESKFYLAGAGVALIVAVPATMYIGVKRPLCIPLNPRAALGFFLVWQFFGLVALAGYHSLWNFEDTSRRKKIRLYLQEQVSPFVSLSTKLLTDGEKDHILPHITREALVPVLPETKTSVVEELLTRPSVLYLAVESLRADLLFKTVNGIEVMPNLNRLAKKSIVFTNAWSQASHTDYSLPSYLGSTYPLRLDGQFLHDRTDGYPKPRIYDHLAEFGYKSAIITSDNTSWLRMKEYLWSKKLDVFFDSQNLPSTFTLSRYNDGYVSSPNRIPENGADPTPDHRTVDYAIEWIREQLKQKQPYYLHTMFQDTHFPYKVHVPVKPAFQPCEIDFAVHFYSCPPEKIEVLRNAYYNAARSVDTEIGRLLTFLEQEGQLDKTAIVLIGDHGEAFLEHGVITHAGILYDEIVRVPAIIYYPSIAGKQIEYPAQVIDLAPTLCGLLGMPADPAFQGTDLLSDKRPALEQRLIYLHAEVQNHWRGDAVVAAGRWKLMWDRKTDAEYLFDLKNDPSEKRNLIDDKLAIADTLRKHLLEWRQNQLAYYKFEIFYKNYHPPKALAPAYSAIADQLTPMSALQFESGH